MATHPAVECCPLLNGCPKPHMKSSSYSWAELYFFAIAALLVMLFA